MKLSHVTTRTPTQTETLAGTKRDHFSRLYGLTIKRFECDMVAVPSEGTHDVTYGLVPGHYYAIHVFNTRDGGMSGRMDGVQYFHTPPERDAYLSKKIKAFWKSQQIGVKKNVTRMGS